VLQATVKAVLTGALSPGAEAMSVYSLPAKSMLKSEKVATPLEAATVPVPARLPPAGLVPTEIVTFPVKLGTVIPEASCAAT